MPHLRTATKSPTPQAQNRHATGAGPHGIALAPPAYGLDIVDRATASEGPLQQRPAPAHAPIQPQAPVTPPNRTGLPDTLKTGIESLSGYDLSNVRVHYNSSRPAQLQALAYTQGTEIYVAPGQIKHLPHEAWARGAAEAGAGATDVPDEQRGPLSMMLLTWKKKRR